MDNDDEFGADAEFLAALAASAASSSNSRNESNNLPLKGDSKKR